MRARPLSAELARLLARAALGGASDAAANAARHWQSARIAAALFVVIGGAATWRALQQPRDGMAAAPFGRNATTT